MSRAHVIGMGEVGRRLAGALEQAGWEVVPVTRQEGWDRTVDTTDPAPRIVAVREEALAAVLERLPEELAPDAPEWGIPRNHFELVRASWGDRARVLRRAMN